MYTALAVRVLDQPRERDLEAFSHYLWLQRIRHRIYEEGKRQILEVARAEDARAVREAFAAFERGELLLPQFHPRKVGAGAGRASAVRQAVRQYPLTLLLLLLSLAVFLLTRGGQGGYALQRWLHFFDPEVVPAGPIELLLGLQFWRWFTPALIHLSLPHILFNALIVWELGRRIEPAVGSVRYVMLLLGLALGSHWTQYLLAGELFGGLSGVAYGLLGYLLVQQHRQPQRPRWQLPRGFVLSLLIMLVAFSAGVGALFGLMVANGAHWGGLVAGLGLGFLLPPRPLRRADEGSAR